jgi:hypothetical protein
MYAAFVKKYQETKIYPFLFVLLVNDYQKLTHNNFYLDASHHSLNLSTHHILHHSQTPLLIATKHYHVTMVTFDQMDSFNYHTNK